MSSGVHGHENVEELVGYAHDTGAGGVDEIHRDFSFSDGLERREDEVGVEGDGQLPAVVVDGHFFIGFTEVGGAGEDFHGAGREAEAYGVDLFGGEEGDAAYGFVEVLGWQDDALVVAAGDDLPVVRVVAVDEFGDEQCVTEVEAGLV